MQIDRDDAATIRTALGRNHILVLLQVVERNRLVHRTRQQPIPFHRDAKYNKLDTNQLLIPGGVSESVCVGA